MRSQVVPLIEEVTEGEVHHGHGSCHYHDWETNAEKFTEADFGALVLGDPRTDHIGRGSYQRPIATKTRSECQRIY